MPLSTTDHEEIKAQWRARLEDSLSASTRGKRRLLLVASTITLIVVIIGLFPTKIEALGISSESKNQRDILLLLSAVNAYALIGFILYGWADIHIQARTQRNATSGYLNEFVGGRSSVLEAVNYRLRFVFDFVVPLAYGAYAMYKLYVVLRGLFP